MSDEQPQRGPVGAAFIFLLVSIGVLVASFSGVFSATPPIYPTNTPHPTIPRPTALPTATSLPTATPIPAAEARLVIEIVPAPEVPQRVAEELMGSIRDELQGSPLQAESGLRVMPEPTDGVALVVYVGQTAPDEYALRFVGRVGSPPPLRVDEPPIPWFVDTSGDAVLLLNANDDELPVAAPFAAIFLNLIDGQTDEATAVVERVRPTLLAITGELDPSVFTFLDFVTAQVSIEQGDTRRALVAYSQSLRRSPETTNAYLNRGSTYLLLGDILTASDNYAEADTIAEGEAFLLYNTALTQLALGDHDAAVQQADQLTQAPYADTLRGVIAYTAGDLERALVYFERVAALQPESVPAAVNLALTLIELERHEEALAALESLISLEPDEPQFFIYKGLILRELGEPEAATGAFEEAADLDDTNPAPYVELAELALAAEELDEAIRLAEEALTRDEDAGRAYVVIGEVQLMRENWRDARDAYNAALARGERSAELYANLAWANHNNRSLLGAVQNYALAFEQGLQEPLMLYRYGFALYDLGQYEDALEAFEGAINAGYDTADAYAMLALSLDANLRRGEAEATYRRAIELDPAYANVEFLRELPLWSPGGVTRAQTILNRLDSP